MRFPKVLLRTVLWLLGSLGLSVSAAHAQIEAVNLLPLGDWEMETLDDRCIFRRSFGDRNSPVLLELATIDPWSGRFQTSILTDQYTAIGEPFRAGWLPGGQIADVDRITILGGVDGARGILFPHGPVDGAMGQRVVGRDGPFDVLAVDPEYDFNVAPRRFREGVESYLVLGAFDLSLLFATGPMQDIFVQRDACMDNVLISQGVEPSENERDNYRVEMTNRMNLSQRVFRRAPSGIRHRNRPTMITFLLYVDAQAQATSCRLASLPYDEVYERRSCEMLMERAEFEFKEGEAV